MLHGFQDERGAPLLYDPSGLLRLAAARCGGGIPDDFGAGMALAQLCAAFEAVRAGQTAFGKLRTQSILLDSLVKAFRLSAYLRRFPEIRSVELSRPIIIVAPFRTGTTFLHRLLANDPESRWPRFWEVAFPPPAEDRFDPSVRGFSDDTRMADAKAALRTLDRASPSLGRLHPMRVDLPEECFGLLETSLMSHSFLFYADVPSYLDWLDGRGQDDWRSAYEIYANQLRLLQWCNPGRRWLLKSPVHLWHIDKLLAAVPSAHLIQLHRDPVAVLRSFCHLLWVHRKMMCKSPTPEAIGRQALGYMKMALDRAVATRRGPGMTNVIDLDFDALTRDPLGCARTLYRRMGDELSAQAEAAMARWLAEAEPRQPRDDPDLAGFGLDGRDARDVFAAYDGLRADAT